MLPCRVCGPSSWNIRNNWGDSIQLFFESLLTHITYVITGGTVYKTFLTAYSHISHFMHVLYCIIIREGEGEGEWVRESTFRFTRPYRYPFYFLPNCANLSLLIYNQINQTCKLSYFIGLGLEEIILNRVDFYFWKNK